MAHCEDCGKHEDRLVVQKKVKRENDKYVRELEQQLTGAQEREVNLRDSANILKELHEKAEALVEEMRTNPRGYWFKLDQENKRLQKRIEELEEFKEEDVEYFNQNELAWEEVHKYLKDTSGMDLPTAIKAIADQAEKAEAEKADNHDRAEEIITAREEQIERLHVEVREYSEENRRLLAVVKKIANKEYFEAKNLAKQCAYVMAQQALKEKTDNEAE